MRSKPERMKDQRFKSDIRPTMSEEIGMRRIAMIAKLTRWCIPTVLIALTGCTTASNLMNPFYESPSEQAKLGERNDHALNGNMKKDDTARAALSAMTTYQETNYPRPAAPVREAGVIRLMWIPDRLNKSGDLIPAHYYYLKVLNDRWAVQDAFELEGQLNGPHGQGAAASGNVPFVNADDRVR